VEAETVKQVPVGNRPRDQLMHHRGSSIRVAEGTAARTAWGWDFSQYVHHKGKVGEWVGRSGRSCGACQHAWTWTTRH
jgi:hypothetical protein